MKTIFVILFTGMYTYRKQVLAILERTRLQREASHAGTLISQLFPRAQIRVSRLSALRLQYGNPTVLRRQDSVISEFPSPEEATTATFATARAGGVTVNSEPRPTSLVTWISPPWDLTMLDTKLGARGPGPSGIRIGPDETDRNVRQMAGRMPMPESSTTMRACSPAAWARAFTDPPRPYI